MTAIPKPRSGGIVLFGKRKAKHDQRNVMFATLLKMPVALPAEYDVDVAHRGIPTPRFEAYAIVDLIDAAKKKRALDMVKLDAFLAGLRKARWPGKRATADVGHGHA